MPDDASRRPTRTTCPAARRASATPSARASRATTTSATEDHDLLQPARVHDVLARSTTRLPPRACSSRTRSGSPYLLTNPFTADQIVSEIDFTVPGGARALRAPARRGAGRRLRRLDGGLRRVHADRRVFGDGTRGLESHNRYPVLYHCASTEHTRERRGADLAVFIRSGFHGVQPCARVVWGGDPTEDWSCTRRPVRRGAPAAQHRAVRDRLPGLRHRRLPRDRQPAHRRRAHRRAGCRSASPSAASCARRPTATRCATTALALAGLEPGGAADLAPLREAAHAAAPYLGGRVGGVPARPACRSRATSSLACPDDRARGRSATTSCCSARICSPRPSSRRGARSASCTCQPGDWVDLWRSAGFDEAGGASRLGGPAVLAGGRDVTLPAPLDELPLLVRAGAVLPLTAAGRRHARDPR